MFNFDDCDKLYCDKCKDGYSARIANYFVECNKKYCNDCKKEVCTCCHDPNKKVREVNNIGSKLSDSYLQV